MKKNITKKNISLCLTAAMVVAFMPMFQQGEVNAADKMFNLQLNNVTYSGAGGVFNCKDGAATVSIEGQSDLTVDNNNEIRDIPLDKKVTIVLTAANLTDEVKLEREGQQFLNKGTGTVTNEFTGSGCNLTGDPGSNQMTLDCKFGSTPGPNPDPVTDHIELRVDCGPKVTESDITVSYQKPGGSWTDIKDIGSDGTINGNTYSFAKTIKTLNVKVTWGNQDYMVQLHGFKDKVSADKDEVAPIPGFGSYGIQIDETFYTVAWTYDDPKLGEDALVTHGKVNIKPGTGINGSSDAVGGHYDIKPGTNVTVEFIPDRGYQFDSGALNGVTVAAGQEVSTFTFTMPKAQLHLQALFKKTDDVVDISADTKSVVEGSISGENVISSGNLELDVNEETPKADVTSKMKDAAGADGTIKAYINMDLTSFVNKGVAGDAWTEALTEFENPVSITLKLDEKLRDNNSNYYMVSQHKGVSEATPMTYDAEAGTVTFKTNKFSQFAIVTKPKTDKNVGGTKTVKTGDDSSLLLSAALMLMASVGALVIARRKPE